MHTVAADCVQQVDVGDVNAQSALILGVGLLKAMQHFLRAQSFCTSSDKRIANKDFSAVQ